MISPGRYTGVCQLYSQFTLFITCACFTQSNTGFWTSLCDLRYKCFQVTITDELLALSQHRVVAYIIDNQSKRCAHVGDLERKIVTPSVNRCSCSTLHNFLDKWVYLHVEIFSSFKFNFILPRLVWLNVTNFEKKNISIHTFNVRILLKFVSYLWQRNNQI